MSRWRSVWLVARREILERGRSRGFILASRSRRSSWSARSSSRHSCSARTRRPGSGPSRRRRSVSATRSSVGRTVRPEGRGRPVPGRRGRRRGARPTGRSTSSSRSRPTCPVRATSDFKKEPDQAIGPDHQRRGRSRCASRRARRERRRPGRARGRPAAAGRRVARPGDRGRPGPLPGRQHRRGPDPRRHLQLRVHRPDRRRRGEAEPGGRGRPVDRPAARPADGQGPRDRRPRRRPAHRVRGGGARRGARDDRFTLPTTTPGAVALLGLWFVLGYALYSTALGFLGALASRMEEASNASTPGDADRDDQLLRGDLRGDQRPVRHRRHDRDVPPAVGAVRRAAAGRVRRDRALEIGLSIAITIAAIWVLFTIGARVYAGAVLQTGGRIKLRDAWRSAGRRRRSSGSKSPGVAAGVPEDDRWPSQRARPDAGDEPGQRLGRVDRVDEDRLGPARAGGPPRRRLGGPPIAGAQKRRRRVDLAGSTAVRRGPSRRSRAMTGRSSVGERATTTPVDARWRSGGPRAARPASHRSPSGRRRGPDVRRPLAPARRPPAPPGAARGADRPGPTDADHVRPPPRARAVGRRPRRPSPPARRDRPSPSWWTVAPIARRADVRAGRSSGGPDSTRWTPRPARAPAAAVRRAWFDQRRPLVTACRRPRPGGADEEFEVAQLVPPNASGSRSSRLIQISTRPPSAAENRGSGCRGDGPSEPERREAIGRWYPPYHRVDGDPHLPRGPLTTVGPARRAWSARSRSRGRPSDRSGSIRRSCRRRPATRRASTITASARRRSTSCRGTARYTWGPTGPRARDVGGGRRLRLHPGRRGPCRGERLGDRATGRRPDPQLPGFARGLPRRRPGLAPTTSPRPAERRPRDDRRWRAVAAGPAASSISSCCPSTISRPTAGPARRSRGLDRRRRTAVRPQADVARGGLDRPRDPRRPAARGLAGGAAAAAPSPGCPRRCCPTSGAAPTATASPSSCRTSRTS